MASGLGAAASAAASGTQGVLGAAGRFLNKFGEVGQVSRTIANAAISNALTQGIAVATGLQSSFSWRDVAISAVTAPIASQAGEYASAFGSDILSSVASGVAGAGVRRAFGGKVDMATVIADAFGNALGNSVVTHLADPGELARETAAAIAENDALIAGALDADMRRAAFQRSIPTLTGTVGSFFTEGTSSVQYAKWRAHLTEAEVIGRFDPNFANLNFRGKVNAALLKIEDTFGGGYAEAIRTKLDGIGGLQPMNSTLDLGAFYATKKGGTIHMSMNIGNAEVFANTLLHEVRDARQLEKIGLRNYTVFHGKLTSDTQQQRTFGKAEGWVLLKPTSKSLRTITTTGDECGL